MLAAGFTTWFHPLDKPKGAGIADWMEVALDASNQMLAFCSKAYFDREKGYSRAERQSMFWEDPTNNTPLLILIKVAECTFPRLIAQNEYISLTGMQRPEAAAKVVAELRGEQARQGRLAAAAVNRSRAHPEVFNVQGGINPLFTGRDTELARLHDQIRSGTATAITAVQGMGGIGKTSLAREYAHRHGIATRFGGVWWIDADTQSGILAGYDALAGQLAGAVPRDQDQEKTANAVRDWLGQQPDSAPWLVIFDNAPDDVAVAPWLPKGSAKVIVTSRHAGFETIADVLSLDFWGEETTARFLQERSGWGTDAEALSLAKRLDGLPLAAEQAGAYLAQNKLLSFQGYEDRLVQMLDKAPKALPGGYDKSLYATFRTALEAVKERAHGEAALAILNICAFLSPDGVELAFLRGCAQQTDIMPDPPCAVLADDVECGEAVAALSDYSLVRIGTVPEWGQTLILHRLPGEIARDAMEGDEQLVWSSAAVQMVANLMPNDVSTNPSVWPLCARLTLHSQAMLGLAPVQGAVGKALGCVLNQAGVYAQSCGDVDGAVVLLRRLVEISEIIDEDDPKRIATALSNLAGQLEEIEAHWDEAEALYLRALEIEERVSVPPDPSIAVTLSNMGGIPWRRGDFPKAENLYIRAAETFKSVYGRVSAQYATSLNNLGTVYADWAMSANDETMRGKERDIKEEAAKISLSLRGMRHPEVATRQNNLAAMENRAGQHDLATTYLALAIAIDLSLDQLMHPAVQSRLSALIHLWKASGDTAKAARLRAGDLSELIPIVEQIEQEHRDWVAEDPENRSFGPPSPITGATE